MVSSVSEAEDLVQESFLRLHRALERGEEIRSPKAYLSAVITRLAIDHLRSARVRREQYVGVAARAARQRERARSAGSGDAGRVAPAAFLLMLGGLPPRAAFLLHKVFAFSTPRSASSRPAKRTAGSSCSAPNST
jgi:RNA polymerase sigma-70 factor (ECF subfamily)